jgi:hypothetical protein
MKGSTLNKFLTLLVVLAFFSIASGRSDLNFKVPLSGDQEVPPVVTDTSGKAELKVNRDRTEIRFKLEIKEAVDILAVAGAHIHCAPVGVNGPVILFLAGPVAGGFDGKVKIEGTLSDANIANTACGSTISAIVDSMLAGNAYVNVHSAANPGGEIRGQIGNNGKGNGDEDDD